MWSHKVLTGNNSCPGLSAVLASLHLVSGVVGSPCWNGTFLTHVQLYVHQDSKCFQFKLIASQPVHSLYCCKRLLFHSCRTWPSYISCLCHPISPVCSCLPEWQQPCPPAYSSPNIQNNWKQHHGRDDSSLMVLYKLRKCRTDSSVIFILLLENSLCCCPSQGSWCPYFSRRKQRMMQFTGEA